MSGFPTCFNFLHETTLKILSSAYWILFSYIFALEKWLTSRLKVLDTTSCSLLNKQLTGVFFYYCWFLNEILPQHHLLKSELKEIWFRFAVTSATTVFLLKAIAMRVLSLEHFKRGIVSNEIFHCGLMFIGIVILQAWPNEGISQSKTSQSSTYSHKTRFCKQQRYKNIWPKNSSCQRVFCQFCIFIPSLTQKHCPWKHFSRDV